MRRMIPVKDIHSGEVWPSVTAAAKAVGVAVPTITQAIQNHRATRGRWLTYATDEVFCECCREKFERKILRPIYGAQAA